MTNSRSTFGLSCFLLPLVLGGVGSAIAEDASNLPETQEPAGSSSVALVSANTLNEPEVRVLPETAENAVSEAVKARPQLVFIFDDQGQLTIFRGVETGEPEPLVLPTTVEKIFDITVIKKNPYCFTSLSGNWVCIPGT